MAKKKPIIPSWEEMSSSYTSNFIDELLKDPKENDPEFQVIDGGPSMRTTTTSNPAKPRTIKAGYDFKTNTMTVVFRDGTWWDYRGVPEDVWYDFVNAPSKGVFLRESGLDGWGDMGPSDVTRMPKHRREQMNDISEFSEYMYGSKPKIPTLDDYLFGKQE